MLFLSSFLISFTRAKLARHLIPLFLDFHLLFSFTLDPSHFSVFCLIPLSPRSRHPSCSSIDSISTQSPVSPHSQAKGVLFELFSSSLATSLFILIFISTYFNTFNSLPTRSPSFRFFLLLFPCLLESQSPVTGHGPPLHSCLFLCLAFWPRIVVFRPDLFRSPSFGVFRLPSSSFLSSCLLVFLSCQYTIRQTE